MTAPTAPTARPRAWPHVVFWIAFVVLAVSVSARNVRKNWHEDQASLRDTRVERDVSDFECFYRGALRMQRGEIMYWPDDGPGSREMATMLPPFQELLLVPLATLPPWLAEAVYSLVSWGLCAWTIVLGRRLAERARGAPVSPWLPRVAFLLLLPFALLVGRYNQTAFFLVFPICAGLLLLPKRALLGGFVLALPAAMKLLPIVVLPWLVWKRAWRASAGYLLGLVATTAAFVAYQGPALALRQIEAYVEMLRVDRSFDHYNERYQGFPNLIWATITPKYEPGLDSPTQQLGWDGVRNFLGSEALWPHAVLIAAIACGLIVLGCAFAVRSRWPDADRRRLGESGLVLCAMLLISPHTFKHYYWWLFPALLFALVEATERRRWALVALAVVVLTLLLPHRGSLPYLWRWAHVFHVPVAGVILLWVSLVWRLWQGRRTDACTEAASPGMLPAFARGAAGSPGNGAGS